MGYVGPALDIQWLSKMKAGLDPFNPDRDDQAARDGKTGFLPLQLCRKASKIREGQQIQEDQNIEMAADAAESQRNEKNEKSRETENGTDGDDGVDASTLSYAQEMTEFLLWDCASQLRHYTQVLPVLYTNSLCLQRHGHAALCGPCPGNWRLACEDSGHGQRWEPSIGQRFLVRPQPWIDLRCCEVFAILAAYEVGITPRNQTTTIPIQEGRDEW